MICPPCTRHFCPISMNSLRMRYPGHGIMHCTRHLFKQPCPQLQATVSQLRATVSELESELLGVQHKFHSVKNELYELKQWSSHHRYELQKAYQDGQHSCHGYDLRFLPSTF